MGRLSARRLWVLAGGLLCIQRAARLLTLHLMRKRTNLYARFHCHDLADLLLAQPDAVKPA